MARHADMPRSVPALTLGLSVSAVALAAISGFGSPVGPGWVVVPLAVTLLAASVIQVEFHWAGDREALDLFEAALVPVIAVVPGAGAVALVALTKLIAQLFLRVTPVKASFNVAQWSLAAAVGALTYRELSTSRQVDTLALVVALVAALVVNHLAVTVVIALARRASLRHVFAELAPIVLAGWVVAGAANVALGLLFATVAVASPGLAALFVGPLVVFGWAQRAYGEVLTDRTRIEALQRSTHELSKSVDPRRTLPLVLEQVREAFSSSSVTVVVGDDIVGHAGEPGTRPITRRVAALVGPVAERVVAADRTPASQALVAAGHRSALVVPLSRGGAIVGALVSLDRDGLDGFEAGELAVFEAVGAEIGNALERAALVAALERERTHLHDIVHGSSDGIFTVTAEGLIRDWNPSMADISGFGADEATGCRVGVVLRARHPGGGEVELDRWMAVGIESLPTDVEIVLRSGEVRTLACSYAAIDGDVETLVVVARDITRQRELDRLRDDFAATVSHELRTPLLSIVGFSDLLLEPPRPLSTGERRHALTVIRKGARRLDGLVSNILQLSQIEARRADLAAPLDIDGAVTTAIEQLRDTWPDRLITVEHRGEGAVRALGDQLSVEQVLSNLIANACKYSDGPVEVVVEERAGAVAVHVRDHGPGIPPTERDRIFERFHRVDHDHIQAGAGLGLYISRQLASAMGGRLDVESAAGQGSTFSLTLVGETDLRVVHDDSVAV